MLTWKSFSLQVFEQSAHWHFRKQSVSQRLVRRNISISAIHWIDASKQAMSILPQLITLSLDNVQGCVFVLCVRVQLPVHAQWRPVADMEMFFLKCFFILFTCLFWDSLTECEDQSPQCQLDRMASVSPHPADLHGRLESNLWSLHISESTLTTESPSQPPLKLFIQNWIIQINIHMNKNWTKSTHSWVF